MRHPAVKQIYSRNYKMEPEIRIPKRKIKALIHDPVKSAAAMDLVYVNDAQTPGIIRLRRGQKFSYRFNDQPVRDRAELARIKSLVIPPAWENVWICKLPNGHIQVTGLDARQRKQYKYHTLWNYLRNQTKFFHLWEFGNKLPQIRERVKHDLALPGLPLEKVLATVVSLMECTSIRIGNGEYEKQNGSFGLSTLKNRHVHINGSEMKFLFKGKKGIQHEISVRNKRLANIVKQCRDIPGKELFQYIDEQGQQHSIDSGMVNRYLHEIGEGAFTAKDFRTWNGSVQALMALRELGELPDTETALKKNVLSALDQVSKTLGNTRTVCKKYYVHPVLLTLYETRNLPKYWAETCPTPKTGLNPDEELLMHILDKEGYSMK